LFNLKGLGRVYIIRPSYREYDDPPLLTITNAEIALVGYNTVRKDRNRQGGRVSIYIRELWNFEVKEINSELEILTIEVIGKFLKLSLITIWYTPLGSEASILDNFENYLQCLRKEDKEFIILGDF
jgi:exonuclease III